MKAKMKPRAGKTGAKLPAGFKQITGGGGDSVDWKKQKIVTGVVLEIKEIDKKNPKKGENPTMRLMRIATKDGDVTVWEKSGIKALFDAAKKGKHVFIQHIGMAKAKKGQSAANLFVAGMK